MIALPLALVTSRRSAAAGANPQAGDAQTEPRGGFLQARLQPEAAQVTMTITLHDDHGAILHTATRTVAAQ